MDKIIKHKANSRHFKMDHTDDPNNIYCGLEIEKGIHIFLDEYNEKQYLSSITCVGDSGLIRWQVSNDDDHTCDNNISYYITDCLYDITFEEFLRFIKEKTDDYDFIMFNLDLIR